MESLQSLQARPVAEHIANNLIAKLKAARTPQGLNPFAVNNWEPGSFARTWVDMTVEGVLEYAAKPQADIAAGGYLDDAEGPWLTLRARQGFNVERRSPTKARHRVRLLADPDAGPYRQAAGAFIASDGVTRYRNPEAFVVPVGGSVTVDLEAEVVGTVGNAAVGALRAVSSLPGVSMAHAPLPFSDVLRSGPGTGAMTVSGSPTVSAGVLVEILGPGSVGVGGSLRWTRRDASGETRAADFIAPIPATLALPDGVLLSFSDGVITPSFLAGDFWRFGTVVSPLIVPGRDEQSDASLRQRCRAQWPLLAVKNGGCLTADAIETLTFEASDAIEKVISWPSREVAGQVEIVIAGAGTLDLGTAVLCEQFLKSWQGSDLDKVRVSLAREVPIEPGGTVKVAAASLGAVQTRAQALWNEYIRDLPIGGERLLGGAVSLDQLTAILLNAGALQLMNETFNGVATDLKLRPFEVATLAGVPLLKDAFTWIPV